MSDNGNTMSIGKISEFNVGTDNWRLYVERLEQYFIVNSIAADKQVPTLVTVMGAAGYELLVNLCTPDKPTTKTFKELADILGKHLQPRPSTLAERFKFHHRKQNSGEKICDYVAELKKMSTTCEFGQWLNESLRDQLVCGLASEMIRQRLFAEDKLDFQRACSLALNMEAAEKDAALVETQVDSGKTASADCQAMFKMQQQNSVSGRGVWRSARSGGGAARSSAGASGGRYVRARATGSIGAGAGGQSECQVCGGNHDALACKFKRYVCRVCNREGHLRKMCPKVNMNSHIISHHLNHAEEAELSSCSSEEVIAFNQLSLDECPRL